ncbi:MAG: type II secretion system major pseudopilin GspG [Cellvibrionaceae bacterium]
MKHTNKGFSLIELMVVIVILGVLASFIAPKVMDNPEKARLVKAKSDIRAIEGALNLYKLDKFNYPTSDEGLQALLPKYMDRAPKDPWGNPYLYLSPGLHGDIDIYTLGADKQQGGEGQNKDIGNWNLEE